MSVHGRIIARGEGGEEKPLVDKKEGGRMNRPTGEYQNYSRGRGRGRGGFETGMGHPHGGRGRGDRRGHDGEGGFDRRPVDETTKKLHEDLSSNAAASLN